MKLHETPKSKIHRAFGISLLKPYDKVLKKKKYPPGIHGFRAKRAKKTAYALRLMEKQKLKIIYNLSERQLKRFLALASKIPGNIGENLLKICESKLDNIVYRLGFASTRPAAKQLVSHKHIMVNGKIVNIHSYLVKPGSTIEVRPGSKNIPLITDSVLVMFKNYPWLEVDRKNLKGVFLRFPTREEIPEDLNEQAIIEFFSR